MKLKKKLAEEELKRRIARDLAWLGVHKLGEACYLAGFEKARELALKIFDSSYTRGGIEHQIEYLGEEEV